ncbi:MAG: DapH/DapD/GlmU-related protein [Promethearchaeota archaeon]
MIRANQELSIIHSEAEIHQDAFIDNFTVIGKGVKIEKDVYISKGVKIYGKAFIKKGSYIGENCIIGHPQRNVLKQIIEGKQQINDFEGPMLSIGSDCTIRASSIIYSEVIIGDNCQTGHNVLIREKTRIGKNSLVGTNCVIDGNVNIGNDVSIQTGVYIPLFSKIGNNVFMGPYCKLTNDKYMKRKDFRLKGANIEDFVSIGANSVILPDITLKKGTIVGAGAVVVKDTAENDVIVGNPAKFLKKFT